MTLPLESLIQCFLEEGGGGGLCINNHVKPWAIDVDSNHGSMVHFHWVLTILAIFAKVEGCQSSSCRPRSDAHTLNLQSGASSKLKSSGIVHNISGVPKIVMFPSSRAFSKAVLIK